MSDHEFDGLTKGGIFAAMNGEPDSYADWLYTEAADAYKLAGVEANAEYMRGRLPNDVNKAAAHNAMWRIIENGYEKYRDEWSSM